jgi:hypothetical protein
LIVKLEKDLKKAFKKIKNIQKFNQKQKETTFNMKKENETSEALDLKAEICQMKTKQLHCDQAHREEISKMNIQMS